MRWKEVPYQNFIHSFLSVMPGGRARGNPAQIFSEISQKFLPTDLKNLMFFVIPIWPPFTWYMNFGPAPLHLDFSIFGPLCENDDLRPKGMTVFIIIYFVNSIWIGRYLLRISLSIWILVHIKAVRGELTPKLFCRESKVYWSKETMLSSLKWKLNLILRKKTKKGGNVLIPQFSWSVIWRKNCI